MQSSSVVGDRRIGKSSLLYHIAQTAQQRLGGKYHFFYMDLQDAQFHTANGFLRTILSRTGGRDELVTEEKTLNDNLIAFSDEIDRLNDDGRKIVLCLDEFENTFKHSDEFTEDFFDHMRSLLNVRKMAFVTGTQRALQALSLEGKLTSPFYTIFTVVELGLLTESEAHDFIANRHEIVNFSERELSYIVADMQLQPLKLQIQCDWIIRNRQRKLDEVDLTEAIAQEYNNFFIGRFDPRQLMRLKKGVNIKTIERSVALIKAIAKLQPWIPG